MIQIGFGHYRLTIQTIHHLQDNSDLLRRLQIAQRRQFPSGAVKCWGTNGLGQLGDGTTTSSNVPVQVQGLNSGFTQVSVSPIHACALKSDGKSFCWGDFSSGQLGNNKTAYISSPKTPMGMETGVTAVAAGFKYGCAIQNGSLKCWGYNSFGNLGNGNYTAQANPVQVLGLSSGVTSVGVMVDSYTNDHHTGAVSGLSAGATIALGN